MTDILKVTNITEQMLGFKNKINEIAREVRQETVFHMWHSVK
jgi:hypothetical protein